jgi:hypothetical protein
LSTKVLTGQIRKDGIKMSSEIMRFFVLEMIERAATVARSEESPSIDPHHVLQITPSLLMDF